MIELINFEISPTKKRVGSAIVKYYDLYIFCDVCVYKREKLWIKMPEFWFTETKKTRFVYWGNQKRSDEFQNQVLQLILEKHGFDILKGIEEMKNEFSRRKKDKNEKSDSSNELTHPPKKEFFVHAETKKPSINFTEVCLKPMRANKKFPRCLRG